jgi:hypothetical protein
VKTVSGAEYTFKVRKNQRVKYLKQRISEKEGGLDLSEQQLVFQGKRLEDHKRILDLHAEEDVVVNLLVERSATKVRSRSIGKDIELSITATELDSLIDNFSDVSVQRASFIPCIDYDKVEASPVSSTGELSPQRAQEVEQPGYQREQIYLRNPPQDSVLEPFRDIWEILRNHPDSLLQVLQQARSGLEAGHSPVLASEGSGGTYFMKDGACRNVAVFKPVDEEPEAVNNPRSSPRSSSNEGLKSGIIVGEGAMREVAAYLLDHPATGYRSSATRNEDGFAGVPPTMMVLSSHRAYNYATGGRKTKVGSLQKYIHSVSTCEDMGPANFPVDEVHKISVLDLRLANTDRNGGNILVCKHEETSAINLVPIDHGYSLPDKFEDCTFEWLYWAQAKVPFSPKTLEYVSQLDADRDIYILGSHGIVLRPECARVLRVATMLLKKGAAAGLTAFTIGSMMSREQFNSKSAIETMLETAEASLSPAAREDVFMDSLSQIMDQYIQQGMKFL